MTSVPVSCCCLLTSSLSQKDGQLNNEGLQYNSWSCGFTGLEGLIQHASGSSSLSQNVLRLSEDG